VVVQPDSSSSAKPVSAEAWIISGVSRAQTG
jgi:hypothetical protein